MNIKKIVSAVTAFALSATMFAGFSVTASAAGETTVLYEKGTAETAWTETDLTAWTQSGGTFSLDATYGPTITGSNAAHSATMNIAPEANSIITIDAVCYLSANLGRYMPGNGSYFRFGNVYIMQNDQDKSSAYSIDGATTTTKISPTGITYRVYDFASTGAHTIHMEIDTATNTLITLEVNDTEYLSDTLLENADYTTLAFGYARSGSVSTTQTEALKSIKVTQTTQEITTADYTVKYVDAEGNEIADPVVRTSVVGETVAIGESDKDAITVDGTKYLYDEANSTTSATLAAEGTVLTVAFTAAEKYDITVTAKCGETDLGTLATYEAQNETDVVTVPFPKYIVKENVAYTKAANANPYYGQSVTVSAEAVSTVFEYTVTDKTNVVYYSEAEDIEGLTEATSGNIPIRCSVCSAAYAETDTAITTLPAGKYKITVTTFGNAGATFTFNAGETTVFESATEGYAKEETSEEFVLTEETEIVLGAVGNGGSSPKVLDYVLIEKTGEAPSLTVAVEAPSGVTVATGSVDATLVAEDGEEVEEAVETVDLTDVQTLYIKVENSDGHVPCIVLADETEISPLYATANTIDGDEYYVYQFVGIDLEGAVVTYGDAADVEL